MSLTTTKRFDTRAMEQAAFFGDTGEARINVEGIVEVAGVSDINVDNTSISSSGCYIGKSADGTDADFTVAYASDTTLTLSGYPAGVTGFSATDIEFVRHIDDATGTVVETYSRDDAAMDITANVLTVAGAAFTASDLFVVQTNIPRSLSSGASGAGGGSIVYTNAAGDFTATINNGTKTITITGLPFTLQAIHVAGGSIKKIAVTTNVLTTLTPTTIAVAGGLIALTGIDDFVTGDVVYMTLIGPDKWYDQDLDNAKTNVQNPDYAHYTDPDHIVDVTDATVDQHYSGEIFPASYPYLAIQLTANATTGAAGVVFKFWGTLNPDAATPADLAAAPSTDWADISVEVLGAATVTLGTAATESKIYNIDSPTMLHKYIIQYDPGHATNTVDIFIGKFSA